MTRTKLKKTLAAILTDFKPNENLADPYGSAFAQLDTPLDLPPAHSIYLAFVTISNYPWSGRNEKVAWAISVTFRGVALVLTHRKFGFRILVLPDESLQPEWSVALFDRLKRAAWITDALIEPVVKKQVENGNVTIANRFGYFDDMYRYFRRATARSYKRKAPGAKRLKHGGVLYQPLKYARIADFQAAAMLDAYFGRLEHSLVLILPFTLMDLRKQGVPEFILLGWKEKFLQLFNPEMEPAARDVFQPLLKIKERYRNMIFHGGFDKELQVLYLHMPGAGAVPATLSRANSNDAVRFSVLPIGETSFKAICSTLDRFDQFLFKSCSLAAGFAFISAGLDVAYDASTRQMYHAALADGAIEDLIEFIGRTQDDAANMDW